MITLLCIIGYFVIGAVLVQGTLTLSGYNLNESGFDKWHLVGCTILMWPILLALMVGYWSWAGWHISKHWVKDHLRI